MRSKRLTIILSVAGREHGVRRRMGAMQRTPVDQKIEITTRKGASTRGAFVSATGESITVLEKSGQRSVARGEVRQVRVADPTRRLRNGLIGRGHMSLLS